MMSSEQTREVVSKMEALISEAPPQSQRPRLAAVPKTPSLVEDVEDAGKRLGELEFRIAEFTSRMLGTAGPAPNRADDPAHDAGAFGQIRAANALMRDRIQFIHGLLDRIDQHFA